LQIPPSLNSKAVLQQVCLLFLLHQHWRAPSFFLCANISVGAKDFRSAKFLASGKDFGCAKFLPSAKYFEGANVFVSAKVFGCANVFVNISGAYIFVYFSAFLFSKLR
jgi:hypothetical protein